MTTFYLIDGYAQFFRAYHAVRTPMSSPVTGEPTNLTFGFVGMLLKLLRGREASMSGPPDLLAVALDVSGDRGTFRSQLYPAYKATRPPPPDDLPVQVRRCITILDAIGVPMLGAEGYEADDVIATIADRLIGQDLLMRVVSKDKDLKQLLRADKFELYDIHTDLAITVRTLMDETGLTPEQVPAMLALMGDTVDNVPGVDGVGPKTAAQLVAEFGSVDAVVAECRADKPAKEQLIKGKRRENILAAADKLPLSLDLVTLRRNVPIEFDLNSARIENLRLEPLMPILKELGFNRYQDELKELIAGPGATQQPTQGTKKVQPPRAPMDSLFASIEHEQPRETNGAYRCVRTKTELSELAAELNQTKAFALDTETTSIRPMLAELCGLSFSTKPGTGWYVPVRSPEQESHLDVRTVLSVLGPIIADPAKGKIGHNLKYDLLVLRRAGVRLGGLEHPASCDSMVASYLLDASRSSHGLDALALAMLGRENISIKELIGSGKAQRTFDQVPLDQATPYAAEDADVSLQLALIMQPQLAQLGMTDLMTQLEMPLVGVLAELEFNGIEVDPHELDRQRARLEAEIIKLRAQIDQAAMEATERTFDPDSPKQLAAFLFNKPDHAESPGLGLRPLKRGKTGPSTDAEVLAKIALDPQTDSVIPQLILDFRQLTKLVNTYLVSLKEEIHPQTKRVHASFHQTVAATGRLSSSDPNLQNIPIRTEIGREIRRAFVAQSGHTLIAADYSQIELRLLAHLSNDPALIEAFLRGEDIHRAVAAQIHGVPLNEVTAEQRSGAKMVNFGIVYGITPFGLARRLGVSNTEATEIINGYKKRFAGITTFLQECIDFARQHGYVETMLHRRRPITEIDSNNPSRKSLAERMAINSVVQGSAADLIKLAMVNLQRLIESGTHSSLRGTTMLLQIHDELVFETPDERVTEVMPLITEQMEAAMTLKVPLVADAAAGKSWFESK